MQCSSRATVDRLVLGGTKIKHTLKIRPLRCLVPRRNRPVSSSGRNKVEPIMQATLPGEYLSVWFLVELKSGSILPYLTGSGTVTTWCAALQHAWGPAPQSGSTNCTRQTSNGLSTHFASSGLREDPYRIQTDPATIETLSLGSPRSLCFRGSGCSQPDEQGEAVRIN